MRRVFGIIILMFTFISLIIIYRIIFKNKVYDKDWFGLVVDSWEIVALAISLILVGLVLIFKK